MVDREELNEASSILNSPTAVTSLSEKLDQRQQPSTGLPFNAAVDEEMHILTPLKKSVFRAFYVFPFNQHK